MPHKAPALFAWGLYFFAYSFSSGMVFLICSAIHFEPPSSLRHSLRSMRSARNTSPTRPTGRSEVRGERLKPGSTSARLKARKKPRGDDPRGFLVDKIGAKIGAKPKLPSGSLLPQRILAEKGGFEPPRPLFGPAPLAGVCIRPLCHFSAEILPHAIAVDAYHRRDVLVSAVGSD